MLSTVARHASPICVFFLGPHTYMSLFVDTVVIHFGELIGGLVRLIDFCFNVLQKRKVF